MRVNGFVALAMVITAIGACFGARAIELEKNAKPDARIYDVRTLTETAPDYPGPSAEFTTSAGGHAGTVKVAGRSVIAPTAASIADMIRTRIRPESWDGALGTSIEEMGGNLLVVQTPEVHALIAQLLKSFESRGVPQVTVKALLVPSYGTPDATFYDAASLEKALGADPFVEAFAAPRLVCFNKQRSHVSSGTEMAYVRDLDVNGDAYDPVVSTVLNGVVLDVRPTLSFDRSSCDVELRLTLNTNVKRNPRYLGVSASDAGKGVPLLQPEPAGAAKKEAGKSDDAAHAANPALSAEHAVGVELDMPTMNAQVVRTDLSIPAGKWVLAATLNNSDEKSDKKFLLVFVAAGAVDAK